MAVTRALKNAKKKKVAKKVAKPSTKKIVKKAAKKVAKKPVKKIAGPRLFPTKAELEALKLKRAAEATAAAAKKKGPHRFPTKAELEAQKAAKSGGDDLSEISGVGPVIVGKLNDADITTFAQIAAWTDADVEAIEEKLSFKGRVGREDWIAQAKVLAKG